MKRRRVSLNQEMKGVAVGIPKQRSFLKPRDAVGGKGEGGMGSTVRYTLSPMSLGF
jgi:hypothetical protein